MDYRSLIRDAWAITWRYRFLWVLGIIAGGAVGVPGASGGNGGIQYRTDSRELQQSAPGLAAVIGEAGAWTSANAGLLIGLAVLAVLLGLTLIVLSFVAQGGMAEATTDLATGRGSSLGTAWRAGLRFFWQYVGLWLLLIVAAILIAAAVAAIIAAVGFGIYANPAAGITGAALIGIAFVAVCAWLALAATRGSGLPTWAVVLGAVVLAIPVFPVAIVALVAMSIVVAYAQRAIVVENAGPVEALRAGTRLLRAHVGESLMVWLLNVGLAIGAGIAVVAAVVAALLLLGALGAGIWALAGLTAPTFAYAAVGTVAFVAGVLLVAGIANTFFWNYWTLAYLRLSGQ